MSLQKPFLPCIVDFLNNQRGKKTRIEEVKKKSVIHEIFVINQDLKTEAGVTLVMESVCGWSSKKGSKASCSI